ncbi:MAG TPA: sulfate ABC transporter substrate-binding protein [Chloroflexota bacterium]|nr:sulfate ABC transporter substrate-binding protein [Chloroflexota bacterium]
MIDKGDNLPSAPAGRPGAGEADAREFVARLYRQVPVLDTGARAATTTFTQWGIGDVFITWENEAFLAQNELGRERFELITPSRTILAEPPVSVVDAVVDKRGTRTVAEAYLRYPYTEAGQELVARHFYRPRLAAVAERYAAHFPTLQTFTVDELFGGWQKAHATHFADRGLFDQIFSPGR